MVFIFAFQYKLGWVKILRVAALSTAGPQIVLALLPSLGVGFCEELAFRGYIFQTLNERMPLWVAAGVSAILFAAYHSPE